MRGLELIEKEPLVSIIIPVYNAESYVKRCLDSISSQTYQNIEIIVVNDGSTDNSSSVCLGCANKDKRIRLIEKENEGSGYARNSGLDIAKGDYFFFVDSDDYLYKTCIQRLIDIAMTENAEIVKCSWEQGNNDYFTKIPIPKPYIVLDNISAFRTRKINIAVHGKLYKRCVIEKYRYPKVTTHDDEFFTYKLLYNTKKIVILDENYYYYFLSQNSIMRGKRDKQPLNYIEAYKERILFFEEKNEGELVGISHKEFAIRLMLSYLQFNDFKSSELTQNEIFHYYCNEYNYGITYCNSVKEKGVLHFFRLFPKVTSFFFRLFRG